MDDRPTLANFPNFARASELSCIAADISEASFLNDYVDRHRPVVIRGGAAHWPALERWNLERFRAVFSPEDQLNNIIIEPIVEFDYLSRWNARLQRLGAHDFFDYVESETEQFVVGYALPFVGPAAALLGDLSHFTFCDIQARPPRYEVDRMFLGKNGYTDWHFHSSDETLTVQVVGEKEFALLPPDPETWNVLWPVAGNRSVWNTSGTDRARLSALVPIRARLEPGDVLYIPRLWWHATEMVTEGFGATVARVFRTPAAWAGDLRIPAVRSEYARLFRSTTICMKLGKFRRATKLARVLIESGAQAPIRATWALLHHRYPSREMFDTLCGVSTHTA